MVLPAGFNNWGEGVEGRCIELYSALQRGRPPPPAEAVIYVITASLHSGVRQVKKKGGRKSAGLTQQGKKYTGFISKAFLKGRFKVWFCFVGDGARGVCLRFQSKEASKAVRVLMPTSESWPGTKYSCNCPWPELPRRRRTARLASALPGGRLRSHPADTTAPRRLEVRGETSTGPRPASPA